MNRSKMAADKSKLESLEAQILEIRIAQLESKSEKYDALLEKLADAQVKLSGRVIRLEENEEQAARQIERLVNSSNLQNKLLVAIVTASVGTLATLLMKALV